MNLSQKGNVFCTLPLTLLANFLYIIHYIIFVFMNVQKLYWLLLIFVGITASLTAKPTRPLAPVVNLGNDTSVCVGTTLILNAGGGAGTSYSWSPNVAAGNTQIKNVTSSTAQVVKYWVKVTDATGSTFDTITVDYVATPTAPTVSSPFNTCKGLSTLTANANSSTPVTWWNQATAGTLLGIGNTLSYNAASSATVYAETSTLSKLRRSIGKKDGNLSAAQNNKGFIFDAFQPFVLDSVTINPLVSGTVKIELRNSANVLLNSKTLAVTALTATPSFLGFNVPTGTNYRLVVVSTLSLRYFDDGSTDQLPMTLPGILTVQKNTDAATANNLREWYGIFNWKIRTFACKSARVPLAINVLPTPLVNLGNDIVNCTGTQTLDMTTTGAIYSWSSSPATTQTLSVSQSGLYVGYASINTLVSGTNYVCADQDSVTVIFSNTPAVPTATDVTTCASTTNLTASSTGAAKLLWFDAANKFLGEGSPLSYNATTNATVSAQAFNLSPINQTLDAFVNLPATPLSSFFNTGTGFRFTVTVPLIVDSATVYVQNDDVLILQLQDLNGVVLKTKSVSVLGGYVPNPISIDYLVAPGATYRIVAVPTLSTNKIYLQSGITYPKSIPGYINVTGSAVVAPTVWGGFFNLKIRSLTCGSAKKNINITVLPTPNVALGSDKFICGSSVSLDLGNAGAAAYSWTSGSGTVLAQTAQYTATTSGTYIGIVKTGAGASQCTDRDTIQVEISANPNQPTTNNLTTCGGNISLTASVGANQQVLWWDAASNGNLLGIGSPFVYAVPSGMTGSAQTVYAQATTVSQTPQVLGYPDGNIFGTGGNTGMYFDVLPGSIITLDQITLYISQSQSIRIELLDAAGNVLKFKDATLTANVANQVNLGFLINEGTNYRLRTRSLIGTAFSLKQITSTLPDYYPFGIDNIIQFTKGFRTLNTGAIVVDTARYYNFYNMKFSVLACKSTRKAVNITVSPTPLLNLFKDSVSCGSCVLINAGNAGADAYSWYVNGALSTGTQTKCIANTAAVNLIVKEGSCSDTANININVLSQPTITSLNIPTGCGGQVTMTANTSANADQVLWWSAATGGSVYTFGNPATYNFVTTSNVYAQAYQSSDIILSTARPKPLDPIPSFRSSRGLKFDVYNPIMLDSVTIYSDAVGSAVITLVNAAGTVLYQKAVSTIGGFLPNQIFLGFFITPGTGYKLRLASNFGGNLYFESVPTSPAYFSATNAETKLPGHLRITSSFDETLTNQNVTNAYYYFYNWKLHTYPCTSARLQGTATVLPVPNEKFPKDTTSCSGGNIQLCLQQAGAVYDWTITPANAATLTPTTKKCATFTSSAYAISSSKFSSTNCVDRDTIFVDINQTPNPPTFAGNISICPGLSEVITSSNGDFIAWYDSIAAGVFVGSGDTLQINAISDTTLYAQSFNLSNITRSVSLPSWLATTSATSTGLGLVFDVAEPFVLDSVSIFTNVATISSGGITISIKDQLGNVLFTKNFSNWNLQPAGTNKYKQVIPIGFFMGQGVNNKIELSANTTGIGFAYEPINYFPQGLSGKFIITSSFNTSGTTLAVYNTFYDWKVRPASCKSVRVPVDITLYNAPTHTVSLGPDMVACGDTVLTTGTTYPNGYTYLWSTGETSSTITVTQSGIYSLCVRNTNGCEICDDINVSVSPAPVAVINLISQVGLVVTVNATGSSGNSFSWNFGDPGSGANNTSTIPNPSHTYTTSGNKTITLTVTNDCGSVTQTMVVGAYPVGIDNSFADLISVYPNPASQELNIDFGDMNIGEVNIMITDILGRNVLTQASKVSGSNAIETLNINKLTPGVYSVIIEKGNRRAVKKVLIQ